MPGGMPAARPSSPRPTTSCGIRSAGAAAAACQHGEPPAPGPDGAWIVSYEIGGQQLTDYWFYVHGRWGFDLVLSNPDMVPMYRMSPQQYVAAVGCSR